MVSMTRRPGLFRGLQASLILLPVFSSLGSTQKIGNLYPEVHPNLSWSQCNSSGTCSAQAGKVVLDVGKHPLHTSSGTLCRQSDAWNQAICPVNGSPACTAACYVDGADYSGAYGVTTSGNAIRLKYVTQGPEDKSVGSRVYLMDSTDTKYQIFKLLNREFAFDVETAQVPCGLKGSLYFVGMDADGGKAKYGSAVAGSKYGTGYCDAKCARSTIYVNGQANTNAVAPGEDNHDILEFGNCCAEVDLWNANVISTQLNLLPCTNSQDPVKCETRNYDCNEPRFSRCDSDGCDFNPYRMGAKTFYGPGKTVNSESSKITVITQFITNDGTDTGDLTQIKRMYVQYGNLIQQDVVNIPGMHKTGLITDNFCATQKNIFGDQDTFNQHGGFHSISDTLRKGMVLTMSINHDSYSHNLWLDSNYPLDRDPTQPGVARGTCSTSGGNPEDLVQESPNAWVQFGNIRYGNIGQTGAIPVAFTDGKDVWSQCGGQGYTGLRYCRAPYSCKFLNIYESQCVPTLDC